MLCKKKAIWACSYEDRPRLPNLNINIYQDSRTAIYLLKLCKYGAVPALLETTPSRYYCSPAQFPASDMAWGERLTYKSVLEYADILDRWWFETRNLDVFTPKRKLYIHHVLAHQEDPSSIDDDVKTDSGSKQQHWSGNSNADRLAKLGAKTQWDDNDIYHLPLFSDDPTVSTPASLQTNYLFPL